MSFFLGGGFVWFFFGGGRCYSADLLGGFMQMTNEKYFPQIKRPQVEADHPLKIKINRCLWLRACSWVFVLTWFS